MNFSVIFCKCGSEKVDVHAARGANGGVLIRCYACDHAAEIDGFVLGRVDVDAADRLLPEAKKDAAEVIRGLRETDTTVS